MVAVLRVYLRLRDHQLVAFFHVVILPNPLGIQRRKAGQGGWVISSYLNCGDCDGVGHIIVTASMCERLASPKIQK